MSCALGEEPDSWERQALEWLRKHLEDDGSDVLREMINRFAEQLMAAEANAMCGAGYGERSPERVNARNGYRERAFDTRAGTMALSIPKLRQGSYFPSWLLEFRRRAEQALTKVVCQCYVEGVSTRRVDDIVKAMGIEGISKSQVSAMAQSLDARGGVPHPPSRRRPLHLRVAGRIDHEGARGRRIVNVVVVVATGVDANGNRECPASTW